jgi:hypothetical protein
MTFLLNALIPKECVESRLSQLLWIASGLALVAAGLVLWWARGERVFADLVSASFAWCM